MCLLVRPLYVGPADLKAKLALNMSGMIDPQIFEHLKAKIDEETQAKDELNQIVQKLERDVSYTQGLLSRVHSTPRASCKSANYHGYDHAS